MHNLAVNRRADRGRIPLIVQEGRDGPVGTNELFRKAVKLLRRDTGLNLPFKLREDVMQHGARLTHFGDLSSVFDGNHHYTPRAFIIAPKHSSIG